MHLEIDRTDIRRTKLVPTSLPGELPPGHVALRLDSAALTSNNISYALSGDLLDYWGFFPTDVGWGRLPVMGFGTVTQSTVDEVPVGGRYFGFFPLGDHHVVQADASRGGFSDTSPWRERHASAYRRFEVATPTGNDDALLIFRGLFLTSFLFEDFIREHGNFGARQVIVTSASSKTSIALAHCVQRHSDLHVVGLTSARNVPFTRTVGEYDEVLSYDDISPIEGVPSIVVDMAGNQGLVRRLHTSLSGLIAHSASIGATHWDAERTSEDIPPPRPEFFFAPSQLSKRSKEWGRDEVNRRIDDALKVFIESTADWMSVQHTRGASAVAELYAALVEGRVEPNIGHIVSFD